MRARDNQYRNVATGEIVRAARKGHGPTAIVANIVPDKHGDWVVSHGGGKAEIVSHTDFAAAHVPVY